MNLQPTALPSSFTKASSIDLLRAVSFLTVLGILIASFVLATDIFLVLFLGVLFGVFLTKCASYLSIYISVGYRTCLAIVVTTLLLSVIGTSSYFFVQINRQIEKTSSKIDEGMDELRSLINQYPAMRSIVSTTPFLSAATGIDRQSPSGSQENSDEDSGKKSNASSDSQDSNPKEEQSTQASTVAKPIRQAAAIIAPLFRSTLGLIVNSLLIFFVGLFLAVSPTSNRDGVVKLVPIPYRQRAKEVLDSVAATLWHWLIGRFGSMLVTGSGAFLLLLSLGVPMSGTLGILTAVLTFVPNIGGALALLLAILVALPQGTAIVGAVIGGYLALQLFESYVITPLIQQKAVSLPPALLMACQAIFGVLFGFMGAAVASPALAAAKTAVEMLYVKDYLGDA